MTMFSCVNNISQEKEKDHGRGTDVHAHAPEKSNTVLDIETITILVEEEVRVADTGKTAREGEETDHQAASIRVKQAVTAIVAVLQAIKDTVQGDEKRLK